jgi:trans-2-enoyl-CoA reductase
MMQTPLQTAITRNFKRCSSFRQYHELSWRADDHGEPMEVLKYCSDSSILDDDPPSTTGDLVKIEMLHAPWNPADVNTVQGKYPSPYLSKRDKPLINSRYFYDHLVPGSEGIGRISKSLNSEGLPQGSLVAIGDPGLGTFRSSLWAAEPSLLRITKTFLEKAGPSASTVNQLGGTALRMLSDFVQLKPGSIVLQNAGNSAVGLMVSQLSYALFGTSTVSLVRRGSKSQQEFEDLVHYLETEGKNAMVVAEEDLENKEVMKQFQTRLKNLSDNGDLPKLALNAVGGESAKKMLRALNNSGTLVTYGGMSGQPVITANPQLIFKDLSLVGYWHSRWMTQNSKKAKQAMIDQLSKLLIEGKIKCPPVRVFPLHDFQVALGWQATQGAIRSKLVLDCHEYSAV